MANSGQDPFEEIFKLLVAKLYDERRDGPSRFTAEGEPAAVQAHVDELLTQATRRWAGLFEAEARSLLAPEHLAVCVETLAGYDLDATELRVMDAAFEFLVSKKAKGSKGQYFTPRNVVDLCVALVDPQPDELVADPACGSGGFLMGALKRGVAPQRIWGFDFDRRAARVARALMVFAGGEPGNVRYSNSLVRVGQTGVAGTIETSDGERDGPGFDVIVANPPFAGEVREPQLLQQYELAAGQKRVERDVLFVERCVGLLRPGGRLGIVLPHNKLAAAQWTGLRRLLTTRTHVLAVVGLGRNTFLPHTHQKGAVLVARRPNVGETLPGDPATFFAVSEQDGKDASGRATGQDDFATILTAYRRFRQET